MNNTRHMMQSAKVYVYILAATGLFALFQSVFPAIQDSRTWRDLTWRSAVRDVHVTRTKISPDGLALTVWGLLTKMGCEKERGTHSASTLGPDGLWHYAKFGNDGEQKATPNSRPPSGTPEAFGPWTITSLVPNPKRARFWVYHLQCPDKKYPFLVFDIEWKEISQ
jgi:hypothetical protein